MFAEFVHPLIIYIESTVSGKLTPQQWLDYWSPWKESRATNLPRLEVLLTDEFQSFSVWLHISDKMFCLVPQMTSNICQRLINKVWRSYADDIDMVPEAEGIYTIGIYTWEANEMRYLYVGHSKHMRTRLQQHKHQTLAIDKFVKQQFASNGGTYLTIKWVEAENSRCSEGSYIDCMERKIGYPLVCNLKGGNTCWEIGSLTTKGNKWFNLLMAVKQEKDEIFRLNFEQ